MANPSKKWATMNPDRFVFSTFLYCMDSPTSDTLISVSLPNQNLDLTYLLQRQDSDREMNKPLNFFL